MRTRGATSHDVARLAGVSRTTVSLVLNNADGGAIGGATRARVLAAAATLGYTPNSAARMLVRGDAETIGLAVADPHLLVVDAFVPQLLYGISRVIRAHGYRILVETVGDATSPTAYLDLVGGRRIDGLIVVNPRVDDTALRRLVESDYPVVLLGSIGHPSEHAVNFRTAPAVRQLIDHLIGLGHRRIGHLALSPPGPIATNARIAAYRRAIERANLDVDDALVAYAEYSAESGARAMNELLDRCPGLTAVFAANDTLALGAISAAVARGRRVPCDIAIVGFDDLPFAAFASPPLTTVRNPGVRQGELAAEKLLALLRGEEVERRTAVATEFIIRESCGAHLRRACSTQDFTEPARSPST